MIKNFEEFINEENEIYVCRFCGRECKNSNSLRNHERLCKDNPNRQESPFVKHNNMIKNGDRVPWNKGKTKDSDERIRHNIESRQKNIESGKTKQSWLGKHLSDEHKQKISKSQTDYLIRTGLNRWSGAHSSERTYPEKYFAEILKDFCEEQYIIKGLPYKIDFANLEHKIAIEIDGEQHYTEKKQIEHDKIRDLKLKELGWKTIRVRWSHFVKMSKEEKEELINTLLKYIVE